MTTSLMTEVLNHWPTTCNPQSAVMSSPTMFLSNEFWNSNSSCHSPDSPSPSCFDHTVPRGHHMKFAFYHPIFIFLTKVAEKQSPSSPLEIMHPTVFHLERRSLEKHSKGTPNSTKKLHTRIRDPQKTASIHLLKCPRSETTASPFTPHHHYITYYTPTKMLQTFSNSFLRQRWFLHPSLFNCH